MGFSPSLSEPTTSPTARTKTPSSAPVATCDNTDGDTFTQKIYGVETCMLVNGFVNRLIKTSLTFAKAYTVKLIPLLLRIVVSNAASEKAVTEISHQP